MPKAMASIFVKPSWVSCSFKWVSPTTRQEPVSYTHSEAKTGAILPGPKGCIWFKIRKKGWVISVNFKGTSISTCGVCCSSVMVRATISSNRSRKAGTFSTFKVKPAAYIWPPNCSSKSRTFYNGAVHIKAMHRTRRTGSHAIVGRAGENNGRPVISVNATRSHNPYHAFMPAIFK